MGGRGCEVRRAKDVADEQTSAGCKPGGRGTSVEARVCVGYERDSQDKARKGEILGRAL